MLRVSCLGFLIALANFLFTTKVFSTLKTTKTDIDRDAIGVYYLLIPVITHLSLIVGLEISFENSKIAVNTIVFCLSSEIHFLFLSTEKLEKHGNLLQAMIILSVPLYSLFSPIASKNLKDFEIFLNVVVLGGALFWGLIALFSLKTRKTLEPQMIAMLKRNEARMLSETLFAERLLKENKTIKNILRQLKIQIYFSANFSVYCLLCASLGNPFEYLISPIALILISTGSVFIIAIPFVKTFVARKRQNLVGVT